MVTVFKQMVIFSSKLIRTAPVGLAHGRACVHGVEHRSCAVKRVDKVDDLLNEDRERQWVECGSGLNLHAVDTCASDLVN
jgi:hypothetical protein